MLSNSAPSFLLPLRHMLRCEQNDILPDTRRPAEGGGGGGQMGFQEAVREDAADSDASWERMTPAVTRANSHPQILWGVRSLWRDGSAAPAESSYPHMSAADTSSSGYNVKTAVGNCRVTCAI